MRKIIASGLLLAVMAGTALAQTAPAPAPGNAAAAPGNRALPPPPPPAPGLATADAPDAPPPPPPPGGPGGRLPPPPPPPAKAAHFRLERGDTAVDVKCADDDTTRTCADIALQMLDKLQALPSQANASTKP